MFAVYFASNSFTAAPIALPSAWPASCFVANPITLPISATELAPVSAIFLIVLLSGQLHPVVWVKIFLSLLFLPLLFLQGLRGFAAGKSAKNLCVALPVFATILVRPLLSVRRRAFCCFCNNDGSFYSPQAA